MEHFACTFLTYFIRLCHQNNLINQQTFQSNLQSPRNLFCKFKSFAPSHRSKINSIQNQCKIRCENFKTFQVTGDNRKLECSRLQSLVPQGIAIPVPVQNLQAIILFPMKHKPTSRLGIASNVASHKHCQTVKTLPHICWFNAQQYIGVRQI
jgi:hypothetical protein